jgi:hypothetical protein
MNKYTPNIIPIQAAGTNLLTYNPTEKYIIHPKYEISAAISQNILTLTTESALIPYFHKLKIQNLILTSKSVHFMALKYYIYFPTILKKQSKTNNK